MKILLTGHHGYIGSVAGPFLISAGHEVVGLDTCFYEGCDLFADTREIPFRRLDVRDVEVGDLEGYDGVVHLAALSNDPLGDLDPTLTSEINFDATVGLARTAREAGVPRFVFGSSCSIYGAAKEDDVMDESAPLRPLTPYAESKIRSEEALAELADDDFAPVLLRNSTAYGASPRLRLDVVLNNLVGSAFTTGEVRILSDGMSWRPLIHIEDIARGILAALDAPIEVVRGEAFNVGRDDENYQIRDLAEIVHETVPGCRVEYAGRGDPDPRSYRVDFGKFRRTFPETSLEWDARRGAEELLEAYRAAGLTFADFESHRFTRLKQLKKLLGEGELGSDLRWRDDRTPASIEPSR